MEKLICVDIDGTILPFDGEINPQVFELFEKESENFIIATGRPLYQVREFGLNLDCVCSNGAEIVKGNKLISLVTIPVETVKAITDYLFSVVGNVSISTTVGTYFHESVDLVQMAYDMVVSFNGEFSQEKYDRIYSHFSNISGRFNDVEKLIKTKDLQVTKIEATTLEATNRIIDDINKRDDVVSFSSVGGHLEVVCKNVNKAEGIKKYLGSENKQVFAVGDGDNDIEMFEYADVSYAMGNATPRLLAKATHVTANVEEDGFLKAVEHLKTNY